MDTETVESILSIPSLVKIIPKVGDSQSQVLKFGEATVVEENGCMNSELRSNLTFLFGIHLLKVKVPTFTM